jgi:hypothetical protein
LKILCDVGDDPVSGRDKKIGNLVPVMVWSLMSLLMRLGLRMGMSNEHDDEARVEEGMSIVMTT